MSSKLIIVDYQNKCVENFKKWCKTKEDKELIYKLEDNILNKVIETMNNWGEIINVKYRGWWENSDKLNTLLKQCGDKVTNLTKWNDWLLNGYNETKHRFQIEEVIKRMYNDLQDVNVWGLFATECVTKIMVELLGKGIDSKMLLWCTLNWARINWNNSIDNNDMDDWDLEIFKKLGKLNYQWKSKDLESLIDYL